MIRENHLLRCCMRMEADAGHPLERRGYPRFTRRSILASGSSPPPAFPPVRAVARTGFGSPVTVAPPRRILTAFLHPHGQ